MAFFEQIEIESIKQAFKSTNLYFVWLLFVTTLVLSGLPINSSWVIMVILSFVFSLIFVVDIKEYIIPDSTQISVFVLANALIFFNPYSNWIISYSGGLFAFLIFFALHYVYDKILKRPALGFGDVKLFANVGLLTGILYFNNFLVLLTGMSLVFLLVRIFINKKEKQIPYGPFIVSSAWLCLLYQESIDIFIKAGMESIVSIFV